MSKVAEPAGVRVTPATWADSGILRVSGAGAPTGCMLGRAQTRAATAAATTATMASQTYHHEKPEPPWAATLWFRGTSQASSRQAAAKPPASGVGVGGGAVRVARCACVASTETPALLLGTSIRPEPRDVRRAAVPVPAGSYSTRSRISCPVTVDTSTSSTSDHGLLRGAVPVSTTWRTTTDDEFDVVATATLSLAPATLTAISLPGPRISTSADGDDCEVTRGGTGFGVRLLVDLVCSFTPGG